MKEFKNQIKNIGSNAIKCNVQERILNLKKGKKSQLETGRIEVSQSCKLGADTI